MSQFTVNCSQHPNLTGPGMHNGLLAAGGYDPDEWEVLEVLHGGSDIYHETQTAQVRRRTPEEIAEYKARIAKLRAEWEQICS